ncbi:MAG: D-alanyl-D-alanine carboxypeptidase family protein [Bacilli bacterium]
MKKIIGCLLVSLLFIPFNLVKADTPLAPHATSVIVLEPTTGEVIYERNANERRHPASMTKIMTMLLVVEAIDKDLIKWDDLITVSKKASSMGGSQILLEENEKMSVEDMFKGLSIASGNDAAVALAEKIGGSEEIFVEMMNKRANELGLVDTNFKNSHGLDEANHYSTAHDMAYMAKELIKHPKVLEFTSIYEDYLRKGTNKTFWLVNTNKLVRFYDGVDGLKTGYTAEAGFCMTATAKINNMRIITTVMGEPDSKTRNADVTSILDYVYAQYALKNIVTSQAILKEVNISKGKIEKIGIVAKEDINNLYKKNDQKKEITYDIEVDKITAPVRKGDTVGKLILKENGIVLKELALTVASDVKKANIFELYWRYLKDIMKFNI